MSASDNLPPTRVITFVTGSKKPPYFCYVLLERKFVEQKTGRAW